MNGVLAWLKKNLVIVISTVLILVFLPVGWVFSSGWNKSVRDKAATAYNTEKSALQKAGAVAYQVPVVLEGESSVSETRAPNRVVTEFYAAQLKSRTDQVKEVVERGTAFNRRDHRELVPGLLPKAPDNRARRQLGLEMAERVAGTYDSAGNTIRASIYQDLLRRLNAGSPPDPVELGSTLAESKQREEERLSASTTDGRMTDAQKQELDRELVNKRLGGYAGRARTLAFYASLDSIRGSEQAGPDPKWSAIPRVAPSSETITEGQAFVWLWDYWVISDVLDAVALANNDPRTGAMPIPDAPVKRVESIRVSGVKLAPAGGDAASEDPYGGGSASSDTSDGADAPATTHTGRAGGTADSAYDIRTVELTVIVASQQIPRLIDALGRVNDMTVVDVDLEPVDVWADLNQGYFYGADHVVRARMTVETVWLRSWTAPLMPDSVRQSLGLPPLETTQPEDPGSGEEQEP